MVYFLAVMAREGDQQLETPRQPHEECHEGIVQVVLMIIMTEFHKSHGSHDSGDCQ
jgi:hypothetical protein